MGGEKESTPEKRIISLEERYYIEQKLASLGLVDASLYEYDSPEHDDEKWIIRGED